MLCAYRVLIKSFFDKNHTEHILRAAQGCNDVYRRQVYSKRATSWPITLLLKLMATELCACLARA
jgi:hypothetical protein